MDGSALSTDQWQALDRAHNIHPFTDPKYFDEYGARIITRADGCYVYDSDGNKILDGMAGLWCVNVGYGNKDLIETAQRQLETLPYYNTFFQSASPTQIELAVELSKITPGDLNHFFFANSGSEANDTVIRLVRHYWKTRGHSTKTTFISRKKAYHGSTLAAVSLGGMAGMHQFDANLLPGFEHILEPHWYAHGADMTPENFGVYAAQKLEEKILELGPENVAAFIGEPIQGAGGVIDPPMSYWGAVNRICKKYDILLIADEVICGFGRTGEWFGTNYYGIEPDIICMAKGLSSGYLPISAVAMNPKVHETIHEGGTIFHGYTYSGHPVCCAVATTNLQIMQRDGLVEQVRAETAPYFRKNLEQLANNHNIIGEVRGAGLIAALQLVKDKNTKEFFDPSSGAGIVCREANLTRGLIMRAVEDSMILCPPLIITKSEIDELVEKASAGLRQTEEHFDIT